MLQEGALPPLLWDSARASPMVDTQWDPYLWCPRGRRDAITFPITTPLSTQPYPKMRVLWRQLFKSVGDCTVPPCSSVFLLT